MTLDLDIATENPSTDPMIADLTADLTDVTWEVLTTSGPAGGWPVIRFTGSAASLTAIEARYNGDGA